MNGRSANKGASFEEILRNYFDHSGFYAVRGVPYRFEDDDVTDIDVWLYERSNAMSRRRAIVDAKNKQRPKAVERVLWVHGLKEGLGVEGAFVATTDRRQSVKKFAASVGVTVLDGEAVNRMSTSASLNTYDRISLDDLMAAIVRVDLERKEKNWRRNYDAAKSSLIKRFGFLSANQNIEGASFFLGQALTRRGEAGEVGYRLFLMCLANTAVSLDYATRDAAFSSPEERLAQLIEGLRFGEIGGGSSVEFVKLSINLLRQYADNGPSIAKQVESRFFRDADKASYDAVAEYVARIIGREILFRIAKELDAAAFAAKGPVFENLSAEAKSFVLIFFDLFGVPRKRIDELQRQQPVLPFVAGLEKPEDKPVADEK